MKDLLRRYGYLSVLPIYGLTYLALFFALENRETNNVLLIHTVFDDMIPFCEYFVVFYYFWFIYIIIMILTIYDEKVLFEKTAFFFMVGMTVFLIVSFIMPNGHDLRPENFARDNVFTGLVKFMYRIDTPTNLLPSIHVFNSLGCHFAFVRTDKYANKKAVKYVSLIVCVLIVMSTMLIKQHSVVDVLSALILGAITYWFSYKKNIPEHFFNLFSKKSPEYSN